MTIDIRLGDCLEVLATMPENSVDTCITDPPYELGFMGKKWDSSGVAFQPETWQEVYRVLKPGATLLAFGGTRTYHRMVCAIEDAGFEIRDTIAWVYGSGFPKSYDISKGIDKQAGAQREVVAVSQRHGGGTDERYMGMTADVSHGITAPSTPEAQLWHGWGTALKPAFEPIVLAMKPVDGNFVNNALTWGVAGYWIDGGRVGSEGGETHTGGWQSEMVGGKVANGGVQADYTPKGRFPANLIHDGSDEVMEVFPETKSGGGDKANKKPLARQSQVFETVDHSNWQPDSGSASRFFYCAKASRSERNAGLEGMEAQERVRQGLAGEHKNTLSQNAHPTVKPIALMRYLVRLTKTPTGGVVLDPFMGSGTTGIACELEGRDFIGVEREPEYIEIAEKRIAHYALPIMELVE